MRARRLGCRKKTSCKVNEPKPAIESIIARPEAMNSRKVIVVDSDSDDLYRATAIGAQVA